MVSRAPPWSPTANREEVRAYLQQRLTLFAVVMFWIFTILMVMTFGMYGLRPEVLAERAYLADTYAVVSLIGLAITWGILKKRRLSVEQLYFLDTAYALAVGIGFGLSSYFKVEQRYAVYGAFIWHAYMVSSRAIIVPSTPRRTAVVSALSFLPMLIGAIFMGTYYEYPDTLELPPAMFGFVTYLSAFTAVALATTGSRVIYGLTRQLREARHLGPYTLLEKIGEGGMGEVYLASHAMLRRPCAVKRLLPSKHGVEAIARFELEVQNMSRLTHPNTVAVYDYNRSPDGTFYYAMEFLDGIDLQTLVRREGPQAAARVIRILAQVCGALEEAHGEGLTHRDIKPANVILCRRGGAPDVAKVVDFGLVKQHRDDPSSPLIVGTPEYLPPEAVTEPDRVGPASDLYSLGAVGYFLLTGQTVFSGTATELCTKHAASAPRPPSERTERPIPADLEALILSCLAKNPADRPASAAAMREALLRLPAADDWSAAAATAWWDAFVWRPAADAKGTMPTTIDVVRSS
jgi:serine/threonine-protein kinase